MKKEVHINYTEYKKMPENRSLQYMDYFFFHGG